MPDFAQWLQERIGLGPGAQWNLAATLLVILAIVIGRRLVLSTVYRRTEDVRIRYRWQKSSKPGRSKSPPERIRCHIEWYVSWPCRCLLRSLSRHFLALLGCFFD